MFDDENVKRTLPERPVLDTWSIAELEERIIELQAEIERTRATIRQKSGAASAADAVFKR
ncbi:DUF1192 domain-containing protein [Oceanibacterium hippocampi]|uniref:Uncharacterized protein n=1 Tax=Oceanibacterium hippocampi TaxID=745714 RepID=A0A1Y5U1P1_9PROT|nr:DUF1192 domain-containing protein [Oceanibacterium hippocampi]SLN74273.1 hypothetical protein OCH7691_03723 [Oceanibacterium hippocampi]